MKRAYIQPSMTQEKFQVTSLVCQSMTSIDGNTTLGFGGSSDNDNSEEARVKSSSLWDKEW